MADGLRGKYRILRADGRPADPKGQYFVLKLNSDDIYHAAASQAALLTYADAIDSVNPELAKDLRLVSADAALGAEPTLWQARTQTETEKRFPIQGGLTVSWEAAEKAYATYSKHYGTSQTLERLAERAGFGLHEFALLYLGMRGFEPVARLEGRIATALAEADIRPVRRS